MSNFTKWAYWISLALLAFIASCSGKSDSGESDISGESIYRAGSSVAAASFSESGRVDLFLVDAKGRAAAIHDGDYINPGTQKFAVKIDCDPSTIDKVFVTDGGVYQVQATPQDGMYIGEFYIREDNLYQVMLVQVIHRNGRATKEKIVIRTSGPDDDGQYVKNGMGLLIAQEILDGQKEALAGILDARIRQVFDYTVRKNGSLVTELSFGDNNASSKDIIISSFESADSAIYPNAALHISFVVKNVSLKAMPLYNQALIASDGNDLAVDAYLSFEDRNAQGNTRLILDFMGSTRVAFAKPFFLKGVVEDLIASGIHACDLPPIALDLVEGAQSLKNYLPGRLTINGSDILLEDLISGLDLDLRKYLFVDLYSLPDAAPGELALGLGFCLESYDDIQWETASDTIPPEQTDAEEIFDDMFRTTIDSSFEAIRLKYRGVITELSYGDNDSRTDDFVINGFIFLDSGAQDTRTAQVNFTVKQVDLNAVSLFGIPLIHTIDNDLTIDAVFSIQYRDGNAGRQMVIDTQSVSEVSFSKVFIGKTGVEGLIRQDLLDMDEKSFGVEDVLSGLTLGIDMAKALSTQEVYPAFPHKIPVFQSPGWTLDLPDSYTITCSVSQNTINKLLANLLDSMSEWDAKELIIPILGNDFAGFNTARSVSEETIIRLSVPPAVDLRSSSIHLLIPDVILQYRVSGVPQWEASIDLDLIVIPSVAGKKLNLHVTPAEGQNHFHVMKDNRGNLGIFDHSSLVDNIVKRLPGMLGGSSGDPLVSIDLAAWEPTIVLHEGKQVMRVTSGNGYLAIDLAASSLDLEDFIGF